MTVAGAQMKNIKLLIKLKILILHVNEAHAKDLEENDPTNYIANEKVFDKDLDKLAQLVAVADTAGGIVNINY